MHRGTILTKTGKGLKEATGKTSNLSRDLRNVLKEIDGQISVSKLLDTFEKVTEPKLLEVLKQLEMEGYVREFVAQEEPRSSIGRPSISQPPANVGDDLDFTSLGSVGAPSKPSSAGTPSKSSYLGPPSKPSEDAKLQAQAQEIARQVQARRAHEDAAARARAEAETLQRKVAEARARKAIEEKARQEIAERTRVGAAASVDALDRARHEAEERLRREAEEKARLEAEARARVELELGIRRESDESAGKESAEKAAREAAERARRDAEESARREREERARAEQAARLEAEARAKLEAEIRVRRELEERARREASERARQEELIRRRAAEEAAKRRQVEEDRALERSLREQEEKARQDTEREREEQEHRQQEERARREAGERARREEEEKRAKEQERQARDEEKAQAKTKVRAEAEPAPKAERAKERAGEDAWRGDEEPVRSREAEPVPARAAWAKRKPRSVARQLPALLIVVLIVAIAAIPLISLETGPYEKAAQTWLDQPVKIGAVSWSLFPRPQLKFEKVTIGRDPQVRVGAIKATPEVLSLLAERKVLRALDLENASFPREFLPVLLIERGKGRPLGVERITAKGLKLDLPEVQLAAVDLDAAFAADGSLKMVTLLNAERKLSVKLEPQRGRAAIEISSGSFPLPIGFDQVLTDFVAKGTVTRSELALSEVEVRGFGGRLLGSMRLRWTDGWSVDGAFTARQLDVAKLAAPLLTAGSLDGKAAYSMRATAPDRLLANARLEGNFIVQKGSIANIDMTRLLQGSSSSGTTAFTDMSGGVLADSNRVSVRQIRLAAGLMNGTGQVDMDSQSRLSGRLQLELRSAGARATLSVGGTLQNPQYRRN